jgi:hypothetical protein
MINEKLADKIIEICQEWICEDSNYDPYLSKKAIKDEFKRQGIMRQPYIEKAREIKDEILQNISKNSYLSNKIIEMFDILEKAYKEK